MFSGKFYEKRLSFREKNMKMLLETATYKGMKERITCIITIDTVMCIMHHRKYHLHNCNRDSHLHNWNKNCHPETVTCICATETSNCITATETVTCIIVKERPTNIQITEITNSKPEKMIEL